MNDSTRLSTALFLSLLLHSVLVGLLAGRSVLRPASLSAPPTLDVDLVPLPRTVRSVPDTAPPEAPPALQREQRKEQPPPPVENGPSRPLPVPEQQLVSPPEGGENKVPEKTRFLSDRDTVVPEESVRRAPPAAGEPQRGPLPVKKAAPDKPAVKPPSGPARAADARTRQELASVRKLPGLEELLPGAPRLVSEGYGQTGEQDSPADDEARRKPDLLGSGEGWRMTSTRPGTLDFLPDVREGDITLLNTKAELFSPFVRRVAVRVFAHLVMLLRRQLDGVTSSNREWVTVEAVMDERGNLASLEVKERSPAASLNLDRSLQRACQEGFFDRNPPAGAEAKDGRIHFLLSIQVATYAGPEPHSLGYQALFSAGLL